MPTKTYSLKSETIQAIADLAERTVRTQGAIIDIAIAALVRESLAADDGGVDLPSNVTPLKRRVVKTRAASRVRARPARKALAGIAGVRKGM